MASSSNPKTKTADTLTYDRLAALAREPVPPGASAVDLLDRTAYDHWQAARERTVEADAALAVAHAMSPAARRAQAAAVKKRLDEVEDARIGFGQATAALRTHRVALQGRVSPVVKPEHQERLAALERALKTATAAARAALEVELVASAYVIPGQGSMGPATDVLHGRVAEAVLAALIHWAELVARLARPSVAA
jgi:hypothetical protein